MRIPDRTFFLCSIQRAAAASAQIEVNVRGTIRTAHDAFGGHISSGLLKRGRNAVRKRCDAIAKLGRKEIFLAIYDLPNLFGHSGINAESWRSVDVILEKCHLYKDLSDPEDYCSPSRDIYCYPKIEALRGFVSRYGNLHEKTLIRARLEKSDQVAIELLA